MDQRDCPFCRLDTDRNRAESAFAVALIDGFPVAQGHPHPARSTTAKPRLRPALAERQALQIGADFVAADRMDIAAEFLAALVNAFEANKRLADRAVAQAPDDKLHAALDAHTNPIAVMMKHVAGNLASRWTDFLKTDSEKPWRNRGEEFVDSFGSRSELLGAWERGWACLLTAHKGLTRADLAKTALIRGEPHAVPPALERSLGHACYHIGQIVQVARGHAGGKRDTLTIPGAAPSNSTRRTGVSLGNRIRRGRLAGRGAFRRSANVGMLGLHLAGHGDVFSFTPCQESTPGCLLLRQTPCFISSSVDQTGERNAECRIALGVSARSRL